MATFGVPIARVLKFHDQAGIRLIRKTSSNRVEVATYGPVGDQGKSPMVPSGRAAHPAAPATRGLPGDGTVQRAPLGGVRSAH